MTLPILNRDFQHPADGWYQIEVPGEHLNRQSGVLQVVDDNCYSPAASNVKVLTTKPFGGAWVMGRKMWHGALGLYDISDPHIVTGVNWSAVAGFSFTFTDDAGAYPAPPQTHFLIIGFNVSQVTVGLSNPALTGVGDWIGSGSSSVGRTSGMITNTATLSDPTQHDLAASLLGQGLQNLNTWVGYFTTFKTPNEGHTVINPSAGIYQMIDSASEVVEQLTINLAGGSFARLVPDVGTSKPPLLSETLNISNLGATFTSAQFFPDDDPTREETVTLTVQTAFTGAYTSGDCGGDWAALKPKWDMSDYTLYNLRSDGELANSPMMQYDETGPSAPAPDVGGAGSTTSNFSGAMITHNPAGFDRHFWFDFTQYERDLISDFGYAWTPVKNGAFSDGALPPCSLRWRDKNAAQYDAAANRNGNIAPPANFPQWWWDELGSIIYGGWYCQITQPWPAVNFNRPCGNDKYLIDQTTVCCISSGDASTGYTVTVAGSCAAPLTAGGLKVGNPIIVGGVGVFQITNITGGGPWTIHVGAQTDNLPAGFQFSRGLGNGSAGEGENTPPFNDSADGSGFLGLQRFPNAPAGNNANSPSNRTGVYLRWSFNNRASQYPNPPTWYAGVHGCTGCDFGQFNFSPGKCPAAVVLSSGPEAFGTNQVSFDPSGAFVFDDLYGGHGQAAIMLTMEDPFEQAPFAPECGGVTFNYAPDDGTGQADAYDIDGNLVTAYYPHPTLVEALCLVPAGKILPPGVTLPLDPTANEIAPPFYVQGAGGIPIGNTNGDFATIETEWIFALNVCNNAGNRFSSFYTYVNCGVIP